MKSFLVIGLGRFGRHLAMKLIDLGNEVMVIDRDEERVARLSAIATSSCIGDCRDEHVVEALGIPNYDVCFVCVSDDFQCSLEVTSTLKDLGAKCVVSRADRERQVKFLKKIGADYVIHTEMDMAVRTAVRFSAYKAFDYFELTPKYCIFEIATPEKWVGKTIAAVNVRSRYNVNILGYRTGDEITPIPSADYVFEEGAHLIAAGDKQDSISLMKNAK